MIESAAVQSAPQPSTIADLLLEAKKHGIKREFDQQAKLMAQVRDHPESTADHKMLVKIFFLDLERRRGDVTIARSGLEEISPQKNPLVEFRRVTALSEVHYRLGNEATTPELRNEKHMAALEYREMMVAVASQHPREVPADLLAYALEGLIATYLEINKIDSSLDEKFALYDQAVASIQDPALRDRAQLYSKELMLAKASLLRGNYLRAFSHAKASFENASNTSYKTYSCVLILQTLIQPSGTLANAAQPYIDFLLQHLTSEAQNSVDLKRDLIELSRTYPQLAPLVTM
jgi:hypothetical protein